MRSLSVALCAVLALACSTPIDERSTEDGSVAHPRCESCHAADFEEVDEPPHAGELPATCFVCHTQDDWQPARLAHDFFPLTGAHLTARCFNCHIILQGENEPHFEGIHRECVDCHRGDYDRSDFPGHSDFPLTCGECHSTSAWSPTLHPPDAWVAIDAGVADPDRPVEHRDAGTDAGHHHRTPHTVRHPPPTTTTPPPTTTTPPDVYTGPSRRR